MLLSGHTIDVGTVLLDLGIEWVTEINNNCVTQCPWPANHSKNDDHPSFSVNLETGAWICYAGCGKGSLKQLVQQIGFIDKWDVDNWLLSKAGTVHYDWSGEFQWPVKVESTVSEVEKIAQADYALTTNETTSSYFLDRGFTFDTIWKWGIRYDRNLPAIVLPVIDENNTRIVGLIRRLVPPLPKGLPKYLFTPGFEKSRFLFGANRHPRDGRMTIIVEGPLDALWLHQYGYSGAVALMGATCSKAQVKLLSKLGAGVILALDNDPAGNHAMSVIQSQLGKSFVVDVKQIDKAKDVQELDKHELQRLFGSS